MNKGICIHDIKMRRYENIEIEQHYNEGHANRQLSIMFSLFQYMELLIIYIIEDIIK